VCESHTVRRRSSFSSKSSAIASSGALGLDRPSWVWLCRRRLRRCSASVFHAGVSAASTTSPDARELVTRRLGLGAPSVSSSGLDGVSPDSPPRGSGSVGALVLREISLARRRSDAEPRRGGCSALTGCCSARGPHCGGSVLRPTSLALRTEDRRLNSVATCCASGMGSGEEAAWTCIRDKPCGLEPMGSFGQCSENRAKVEGLNRSWGIKPFWTRSREERTTARTGRTQSPFGQRPCAMASAWRSCPAAPTAHMLPSTTCLNCCRFRKQVRSKGVH
jgi:hypothetical protein